MKDLNIKKQIINTYELKKKKKGRGEYVENQIQV